MRLRETTFDLAHACLLKASGGHHDVCVAIDTARFRAYQPTAVQLFQVRRHQTGHRKVIPAR